MGNKKRKANPRVKLRKVLVVYKKSTYQIQAVEHREPRFLKLLEEGHQSVTKVKTAHAEHMETLEAVEKALSERNIEYESFSRMDVNDRIKKVDLVVSVGGDGTFLDTSHFVGDLPLLGVNSSRSSSFGHFCLGDMNNIGSVLDEIVEDAIEPLKLLRLELELNGSILPEPVLNEVLACHSNPAGTSRFFVEIEGQKEAQRSSGVWIGTPSGSTGALRSAGGIVQPIYAQQYQYLVREPWERPHEKWQLVKGLVDRSVEMKLISQMRTGALYIDGQHIDYNFALGDELIIRASKNDLVAYVSPAANDMFLESGIDK